MLLADLAAASAALAATTKRTRKIETLAALLRRLAQEEIRPAVALLSGSLRQGRIGLGPSAVRADMSFTQALAKRNGHARVFR